MHILIVIIIFTIVLGIFANSQRTNNIEAQCELTTALGLEVVSHRTLKATFGIVFLVGNFLIQVIIMRVIKLLILEVDQQNNSFLIS